MYITVQIPVLAMVKNVAKVTDAILLAESLNASQIECQSMNGAWDRII